MASLLQLLPRDFLDEPIVGLPTINPSVPHRTTEIFTVNIFILSITTFTVLLRLYTRYMRGSGLGRDDYTIVLALVLLAGQSTTNILAVRSGFLGRHITDVVSLNFEAQTKVGYASQLLYHTCLYVTRVSIVFFLGRIMPRKSTLHFGLFCGLTAVWISGFFALAFQCSYPQWVFVPGEGGNTCVNQTALYYANGGIGIAVDLIVLMTPIVTVSTLHLPRRTKVAVVVVFALGGFVVLASVVRLCTLWMATKSGDVSWWGTDASNWSLVEVGVGIVCASLPALRPVLGRCLGDRKAVGLVGKPEMFYEKEGLSSRDSASFGVEIKVAQRADPGWGGVPVGIKKPEVGLTREPTSGWD